MTASLSPQQFVAKWRKSELKERAAAQEHFLDLCHLVGHPTPAEDDPAGERFCFEAGATKARGGQGWADVWKRGYFAWEYKGKHKDLDDDLFTLYKDRVPHECDLVCYWFEKAWALVGKQVVQRAGLLATQAIRGGANRAVLERIKQTGDIFWAYSDRDWILDYDELLLREVRSYPNPPSLPWMPMSMICDKKQPNAMSLLASNPYFRQKRDEHLQMGNTDFMDLERFKANYPPQEDGYSPSQAQEFAWMNAVSFLGRHFRGFLLQFKRDASALDTSKIPSLQMRSLLLFYKYYIHHQSPTPSDFLDFANVSYIPYVDVYVTEKNVLQVLRRIKNIELMLHNTEVIHVREFVSQLGS